LPLEVSINPDGVSLTARVKIPSGKFVAKHLIRIAARLLGCGIIIED